MIFFPTFYFLHTMHFVCEFRSPIVVKVIAFTSVLKINGKKGQKKSLLKNWHYCVLEA